MAATCEKDIQQVFGFAACRADDILFD